MQTGRVSATLLRMHYGMRFSFGKLSFLSTVVLVGCAHYHAGTSWDDHTILPTDQSIASLNAIASFNSSNRTERASAVFTLFSNYVRPGSSAVEIRRVLSETNWMADVDLHEVGLIGGWIPLEWKQEDSVFHMQLFPDNAGGDWTVWFCLSGHKSDGSCRSKEDALAFLRGDMRLYGNPKLVEFALEYPERPETRRRRIERFNQKGIHVYSF